MNNTSKKEYDILLVEDNPDDVFLTKLAIEKSDINGEVTVANNGKAAVELLENLTTNEKKLPDLILLDINLPKMNGLEALENIKSAKATKSIPIVIFTSSDSESDMNYCYGSGVDLYIRKPNNINDLKKIMIYINNHLA